MKFYDSKASFSAGELSPVLAARADLAAYMSGAAELYNCLVLPQGGLINRPGTRKIADDVSLAGARLVPFVNGENSLCLAFKGNGSVDVFGYFGLVHTIDNTTSSNSPYRLEHLSGLRWLQSVDVIYLFHPKVPVYKLKHYSDIEWHFEAVDFKNGPYSEMNTDDSIKISATTRFGANGKFLDLRSSAPFFGYSTYGKSLKFEVKIKASSGDGRVGFVSSAERSLEFMLFGPSTIETHGNWNNRSVVVYRKEPGESDYPVDPFRTWPGDGTSNFGLSVNEEQYGVMFKVVMADATSNNVRITWSSGGGLINRNIKIGVFYSDTYSTGVPTDNLSGDIEPTSCWALSAFGPDSGYPAIGAFHQERLVLANTADEPQTIWMSQPANWENFETSIPSLDTDSITATLAARNINRVLGFSSREDLLIFTSEAEWVAQSGSKSDVFTPSSIVFVPSGYRGSDPVDPLEIGQSILFLQKHGKIVRGMGYQLDIDGYSSSEMSILSSHLTEGTRIIRWAYQQEPWSVVWMVLDNGSVLALTIQQEHQVSAWSRHRFNGNIKDVCVVPGVSQDELFMLVDNRLSILQHRDDRPGVYSPNLFLDDGVDKFVSAFQSMELEQNLGNGSIQGRHKQVSHATLRLFRTSSINAGVVTENSKILDCVLDSEVPFTGDINVPLPGGMGKRCCIRVENDKPAPMTLLGIFQEVTIHE